MARPKQQDNGDVTQDLHFPLAGINLAAGFDRQPNLPTATGYARTTPFAENVRGYEPGTSRARGGQRPGTLRYVQGFVKEEGAHVQELQVIVGMGFAGTTDASEGSDGGDGGGGLGSSAGGGGVIPGSDTIGILTRNATGSDAGAAWSSRNHVIWSVPGPGGRYGTWSIAAAGLDPDYPMLIAGIDEGGRRFLLADGTDKYSRAALAGLGGAISGSVAVDTEFFYVGTATNGDMVATCVAFDGSVVWSQTAIGPTNDPSTPTTGTPTASVVDPGTELLWVNFRGTGLASVYTSTGTSTGVFVPCTNAMITTAAGTRFRNAGQLCLCGNYLAILVASTGLDPVQVGVVYVDKNSGNPGLVYGPFTTYSRGNYPYQDKGGHQFLCTDGTHFYLLKKDCERNPTDAGYADSEGRVYSRVVKLDGVSGAVLWTSPPLAGLADAIGYAAFEEYVYVGSDYALDPDDGTIVQGGMQPDFKCFFAAGSYTTTGELAGGGYPAAVSDYNAAIILLAVAGGTVKVMYAGTWQSTVDGDEALQVEATVVRSTVHTGKVFFADGLSQKYYDSADNTVKDWTMTAGTFPVDSKQNKPTLIVTWRDRVLLAGLRMDSKNIFATRQGDPFDIDPGPTNRSPADPWALNTTPGAGQVGDTVTTMIPFTDDVLVIGCPHSIYLLRGDPLAGGQIDLVTNAIGICWGIPWCQGPDQTVYFMSNQASIFTMLPGQQPQRLSQNIDQLLDGVSLDQVVIRLMWSDSMQGVHVFITNKLKPSPARHLFYEVRSSAWWVDTFASDNFNPVTVLSYFGSTVQDRVELIGSWDGYVRAFSRGAFTDDGIRIGGLVAVGPLMTADLDEVNLKALQSMMGLESGEVVFAVQLGDTPERAITADPVVVGVWKSARNLTELVRRAAHASYVVIRANRYWSMETITAVLTGTGKVRRRGA